MSEGIKDMIAKYLTILALLVIVVVGLVTLYPKYQQGESLKREIVELQEKINLKKDEIARLRDNQSRFRKDADFVEAIARQNHRVFPGEYVFIFEK